MFIQENPKKHCTHPNGHGDARDSIESRNVHSRRNCQAIYCILRRAKKQGRTIRIATYKIGQTVTGKEIQAIVSEFNTKIRDFSRKTGNGIKFYWFAEPTGKERVHFHAAFLLDWPEDKAIHDLWHKAVKQILKDKHKPRRASIDIDRPRKGLLAASKYITGNTKEKKKSQKLFRKNLPFNTCGGSQKFFGCTKDELITRLSRYRSAIEIAMNDPNVLEKTLDHYLQEAQRAYEEWNSRGNR